MPRKSKFLKYLKYVIEFWPKNTKQKFEYFADI